jgi:hypothetical protein
MSVTVASFRAAFPAFASTTLYTDPAIQFWIDIGTKLQNPGRWGDLFDYGIQLFVAHNLVVDYQSNKAGALGQKPGQIEGAVTSGSVDKVSYSRDTQSAMEPDAGHWNLSTYGLRYIRLLRMCGAGPLQVGVPLGGDASNYYPGAWPGPIPGPW